MIDPQKLQEKLLTYLQAVAPLPGVNWRGSDDTRAMDLPMMVVHIQDVKEEWEDSGIFRCFVTLQLHTRSSDSGLSLNGVISAMAEEDQVEAALDPDFTMTALIFKGAPLHHKEMQLVRAALYELLLSENIEVPDEG